MPPKPKTLYQKASSAVSKNWVTAVVATVMSGLTGAVIPMIDSWHSDKVISSEIDSVKIDLQKTIDANYADDQKDIDAISAKIGKLYQRISEDEIELARHNIVVHHGN